MPRKVRPIRVEGNVAYVTLTKGHVAIIDADDIAIVGSHNWCAKISLHTAYAARGGWLKNEKITRGILMHRLITGAPRDLDVDHVNGDGLDNRRANLRLATKTQNHYNQRISSVGTSGFKGVTFRESRGTWRARISTFGNQVNLGHFATAEEAHAAYCEASKNLHGDFGRTD